MADAKFVYWEEDGMWLGYLQEFPDYWTQGETLDDLKEHLADLNTLRMLANPSASGPSPASGKR